MNKKSSETTRQAPSRTLLILGFGTLAFVLAQTTVIPALGDLQRELGASPSGIAWMVTAYLLVASIATPIFGRLGDMFGKQRLLAISLALFAVGSVVAGLADSLPVMIVGRGLQGLGGGVFPLSFGIIRDEFPKHKVPTGIALLGAIAAIGSSIGLPLGGVLVDQANYHWIFWVAATMGVRPTPQPLVNMRTFVRRPVLTTNVSTVLIGSAMISTFMLVPLLAQLPADGETGFGLSATEAGLLLAAGGLLSLLIAPIVGRIGERSGSKTPFFVGCLVTAGALLGMALAHDSVGLVILWSCITSAGVGAAFAAIPNLIVSAVDEHQTGEATGVNTVMRNIGSAVGAQVAGTIIATHVLANGLPDNAGFKIAFLVSAIGAVIAGLSVLLIPGRRSQQSAAELRKQAPVAARS